jgi:histidine ammonia-lyase
MKIPEYHLKLKDFVSVMKGEKVSLSPLGKKKVEEGRKRLIALLKEGVPVYGVNTGFGALCERKIEEKELDKLQKNLILSHSLGAGEVFPPEVIRGAIFLRANALAKGFSGVRPEVIESLLVLLNRHIIPVVNKKGSVGASGDLLPLAQIALVLIGKGDVFYKGRKVKAISALKRENLFPINLTAKEGLSLINGTEVSCAYLAFNLNLINQLFLIANLIAGLSFYAEQGDRRVIDLRLVRLKPYSGQLKTASLLKRILRGMPNRTERIQDPYSFRCIPQVHGACYEVIRFANKIIETEMNSVTDNPVIYPEIGVLTGGNFHAQALSQASDFLSIALTTLSLISERRIFYLLSGPPPFLIRESGKNSGLMMAQVLAASLAGENKALSYPASITSLPTSLNQEDFVSMSINAISKLERIRENLEMILAIEAVASAQAIELKGLPRKGIIGKIFKEVREFVPFLEKDREIGKEIRDFARNLYPTLGRCLLTNNPLSL